MTTCYNGIVAKDYQAHEIAKKRGITKLGYLIGILRKL